MVVSEERIVFKRLLESQVIERFNTDFCNCVNLFILIITV